MTLHRPPEKPQGDTQPTSQAASKNADAIDGCGVVVTGAAGGIGRAIATRLVRSGARVVINDINPDRLRATADEIGAHALPGDLSTPDGTADLITQAKDHLGSIDAWFANAGVMLGDGLDASESEWETSWQVNTMAHTRAAKLLLPDWIDAGAGRFVVTVSAAGLLTNLGACAYSVTKHASLGFAEWLSVTYRHRGVIVQAICPQGVQTAMLDATGSARELIAADGALTPDEVAESVMQAWDSDHFLILPHPKVATYYRNRAADPDRWLNSMNRLQQRIEQPDNSVA